MIIEVYNMIFILNFARDIFFYANDNENEISNIQKVHQYAEIVSYCL